MAARLAPSPCTRVKLFVEPPAPSRRVTRTTGGTDYERAFCKEFSRRGRVSVLVVQGECRRPIAGLQSAFGQSGLALALAQLVRSPMKDFDYRLESVVRWPLDSNFDLRSSSFC